MPTQTGFSLLEILVSLIILSIGMLGLAALQLNAIRYNHGAELRSIATQQALAMIERMRANRQGVADGAYGSLSGIPAQANCTACSTGEMAQKDLYDWNTSNAALLPAGQGTVTGNGPIHTVTVRWDNNRSGATGLGCSGNPQVDLSCVIMAVEL